MSATHGTTLVTADAGVTERIAESFGEDELLTPLTVCENVRELDGRLGENPSGLVIVDIEPEPKAMLGFVRQLVEALPELPGYRVLAPPPRRDGRGRGAADEPAPVPFSAFFVFEDPAVRDRVHRALVDERVYASRLWPLDEPVVEGVRPSDVELSRCTFAVPLDMRYDADDVERAAGIISAVLERLL